MSGIKALLICMLTFFMVCTDSAKAYSHKKMIVVTINTATIDDLLANPRIKAIAEQGVVGLMNTRSNGNNNQYKPYLTLGSGQKAEVYFDCLESTEVDKEVKKLYEDITLSHCSENNLVNMTINRLKKTNSSTPYKAEPGKLGSILKSNNIVRCFIGGFRYENSIKSPGFFIAMDENGLVDRGSINTAFNESITEKSRIIEQFLRFRNNSDFMVVELGEIESLYAYKKLYSDDSYIKRKEEIISGCGETLMSIIENTDFSNTVLCIIAPYSLDTVDKNREVLSPVIIYDGGRNKGILTSKSTRRYGIISALDFAPFVLNYYGINAENFIGYPMEFTPVENHLDYILELNENIKLNSRWRVPVLKSFALFIIITIAIYVGFIYKYSRKKHRIIWLMEFCIALPLSMLLEGLFSIQNIVYKILFFITASAGITFIMEKQFKRAYDKLLLISGVTICAISLDILLNEKMLHGSIFSYDPVIGARFYGIGNEYMGVLTGCSLIFCGCINQKHWRLNVLSIPLLTFVASLTGLPWFGSNVGGLLTTVSGFMVFILLEYGYSIKRALSLSALAGIIFFAFIFLANIIFKEAQSHLGRMADQINVNGAVYFIDVAKRKINMALRLIKYNIWSRVLLALTVLTFIVTIKFYDDINKLSKEKSHIKNSCIGAIISSVAAIAFNDSGIVAAAVIMLYTVFSMAVIFQHRINKR